MPHQKKYQEGTTNRTMTFFKKDLDTLQAHTKYRMTLTDLVQQAIKEYIKRNGWDEEEHPGDQEEPEAPDQERRDKATIPDPTKPAEPEKPDDRNKRDPIDLDPPGQPEPEKPDDPFDGLPDYLKTD